MSPKVPEKTSIYTTEPVVDKYTIRFAPELVSLIQAGEKVKTYRYGDKYDYLNKGDTIEIQEGENEEIIGKATLITKSKTTFGKLPLETQGHESYKNKDHQRKVFSGYYAYLGRKIKDDDLFLILEYQMAK
jgi:hypothetical protein